MRNYAFTRLICNSGAFRVMDIANHGNENGILLSLPQCDYWLFSPTSLIFYKKPDFNLVLVLKSTTPWYSFLWLYHAICPHVVGGTRESEQVSKIYKPRRGLPSCGCCKSLARGSYMQVVGTTCVHFSRIQWYCKSFKNMIYGPYCVFNNQRSLS